MKQLIKENKTDKFITNMQHKYWQAKQLYLCKAKKKQCVAMEGTDFEMKESVEKYYNFVEANSALDSTFRDLSYSINKLNKVDLSLQKFLKKFISVQNEVLANACREMSDKLSEESQGRTEMLEILGECHEKLDNFNYQVFKDTHNSIEKLEDSTTKYQSAMLWMGHLSTELNPESTKHIKDFKKVQKLIKNTKEAYEKSKDEVIAKTKLCLASRNNLVSPMISKLLLVSRNYSKQLWDKYLEFHRLYERDAPYEYSYLKSILGPNNGVSVDDYLTNQKYIQQQLQESAQISDELQDKPSNVQNPVDSAFDIFHCEFFCKEEKEEEADIMKDFLMGLTVHAEEFENSNASDCNSINLIPTFSLENSTTCIDSMPNPNHDQNNNPFNGSSPPIPEDDNESDREIKRFLSSINSLDLDDPENYKSPSQYTKEM